MRKTHLLGTASRKFYRPSVQLGRHGHPMKSDDRSGHESTQAPNNTGVTTDAPNNDSSKNDNNGQSFDYGGFWESPEGGNDGAPRSGESAAPKTPSSGQQENQNEPPSIAAQLAEGIQNLDFGASVMTPQIIEELAEGKTEGFHKNLNELGRNVTQNAIRLMVPLLGEMRRQLREEMQSGLSGNNASRDNEAALLKAIPSAADPKVRPTVDRIFAQSMKHVGNDRTKALAMTKDMLRIQAETLGNDIGIPPRTSGDDFGTGGSKVNWLDELAGR